MDTLENNVRSECKQAFAELQTDMTDLTMDLETSGIPLLDHRTFVMKVFFPGVGDHPLFLDPRIHGGVNKPRTELDNAMLQVRNATKREREREIILTTFPLQFEGLLNNKWFLLAFIETMERQKSFTIRWRKTLNFFFLFLKLTLCFHVRDRVNFASLVTVILMSKMEYCTDILRLARFKFSRLKGIHREKLVK